MSDDYGSEAQRLKFARDWEAAIKRGLEEATSSEYTITSKPIPEAYADMLRAEWLTCEIHSREIVALGGRGAS